MPAPKSPALFLDRDGVIIQNRPDYIRTWAQVEIFPWALDALASLAGSAYQVVIVSNQSAVGRGLLSADAAAEINQKLARCIAEAGGRLAGLYICPHAPGDGCSCRKPQPGLLLQAAAELDLDLTRSIMVGDALEDIEAGRRAGAAVSALVRTGRGLDQLERPEASEMAPFPVFERFDRQLLSRLMDQNESEIIERP